jgi:hypothetical protein
MDEMSFKSYVMYVYITRRWMVAKKMVYYENMKMA